jgi:hypothetical protein
VHPVDVGHGLDIPRGHPPRVERQNLVAFS